MINETRSGKPSELTVIIKAKDLCSYILTVTTKSPKRFRFTLTSKLQNYGLNIIENLYRANEVRLVQGRPDTAAKRSEYQQQALTECRLLGYMAQVAMEQEAILKKQYEQITKQLTDVQNLLGAWMKSDSRRMGGQ